MKKKRGFTIVELVIVIAVIGVLAGILVPTIISLTSSAKFSKDLATVSNINKIYTVDKLDKNIKKYDTMHDALNEISDNNFKISTLQHPSTKDMTIGWDSVNDMFVLINTKEGTIKENKKSTPIANKSDYFIICDVIPTDPEFSIYLTNKNDIGEITHLKVGFDSGDNYSVTRVIYDRRSEETGLETRSVIYRTNPGTDFECYGYVDSSSGEGDIIYHYGESCDSIIDCADGSFYEKGASNHVEVKKGHFVLTNNSFVSYINASATNGNVSVDFLNGSTHGTATNTNTYYGVNIHSEEKAKALNAFYNHHGGPLNVIYDTRPDYTNQTDKNEIIDGKPFVLEGLGSQIRELPHYGEPCEKNGHTFIAVQDYTLRVCEICGSYEHSVYRPSDDDTPSTTTYINRHEGDDYYVVVNSTPDHEHAYGNPVWSWTGYTKAIARFECGDLDCNESITFTYEGSDIERVLVTKENCTQDGVYNHTASCEFNNHEYQSTSPYQEIVEHLGHDLHHHEGHNPSCTEDGYSAYDECVREGCDYTTYQKIEALGHSPKEPVQENYVDSTCTAEGHYDLVVYCDTCGVELSRETKTIPMKEHNGNPCTVCGFSTLNIKLLHTDKYIYKVGTDGEVRLDTFYDNIPDGPNVTFETQRGNAVLTSSPSDTMLTFAGEGILTLRVNGIQPLDLEVVSGAKNVTDMSSATDRDVVLLKDATINNGYSGQVATISNGHIFYGNGFNITVNNDIGGNTLYTGYINLNSGTLDNVQLTFPTLSEAVIYTSQFKGLDEAYTSGNNIEYYYDTANGIVSTGNSTITNSYISGGRAPVCVSNGNLVVENTTLDGGSLANLVIGPSVTKVTLNDLTTIQEPKSATRVTATVVGLGILSFVDDGNSSAEIELNGTLVQHNWIDSSYSKYVPSITGASSYISQIFNHTDYVHNISGTNKINEGIAFLNTEANTIASPINKIIDNRTNKSLVPYAMEKLYSPLYIYSYSNSCGTDSSYLNKTAYSPTENMVTMPNLTVTDIGELSFKKAFTNNKWTYTLETSVASTFSFNQVNITKFGETLTNFTVRDSNNAVVDKNASIALDDVFTSDYTISVEFEGKTFTYKFVIQSNVSVEEINPPTLSTQNYQAGICVASSYGGTWHGAAPVLEGLTITYYSASQKKHVDLALNTLTPSSKGKLNGTNNTWTVSTSDFTLTLTGGKVHDKNNVYAMPVVCDSKVYFLPASSNGLVNTGNSARKVPVSYSFQANGDTLNFSYSWSVAEDKENEYNYSDFCSGKLTKLTKSSGGSSGCLLPDTLITMADGSMKMVKDVQAGDLLTVFNHETGSYDVSTVVFNDKEEAALVTVINLEFDNGTYVGVVSEHGFFDLNLMKYVYITEDNYDSFVGHQFYSDSGVVTLSNAYLSQKYTEVYSPVTAVTLNYFTNGMLSMPGGIEGIFNIFEYDADLRYDQEKMEADIATYGLLDYSYFEDYLPYDVYIAFNGKYLGIAMGKGILTEEMLMSYVERYSKYW